MISKRVLFHDVGFDAGFPVQKLLEFRMEREVNEHVKANIKCILKDVENENDLNLASTEIKVYIINEKKDILFLGDIVDIYIHNSGGLFIAELEALSKTYLLDIEEKNRSFQNPEQTYSSIIKELAYAAGGDVVDRSNTKEIKKLKLQYGETDWEFIKRLASKTGNVIVAENKGEIPQLYFGFPFSEEVHVVNEPNYKKSKNIDEITFMQWNNHKDMLHSEYTVIQFESQELYELGDGIEFQETLYTIAAISYHLKSEGLMMYYTLKRRDNIFQIETINPCLKGLELEGTVIAVQKDEVKLHLKIDSAQNVGEAQWFTYGTSYTTATEPGFYFMPQIGNTIKLYIQDKYEESAIAIQTSRTDGDYNPKTNDPDTKIIGSIHTHEIKLDSHSVTSTAFGGRMVINLDDDGGISITSDGDVSIIAPEGENGGASIGIYGYDISLTAAEELTAQCGPSSVVLNNNVHFLSPLIYMQPPDTRFNQIYASLDLRGLGAGIPTFDNRNAVMAVATNNSATVPINSVNLTSNLILKGNDDYKIMKGEKGEIIEGPEYFEDTLKVLQMLTDNQLYLEFKGEDSSNKEYYVMENDVVGIEGNYSSYTGKAKGTMLIHRFIKGYNGINQEVIITHTGSIVHEYKQPAYGGGVVDFDRRYFDVNDDMERVKSTPIIHEFTLKEKSEPYIVLGHELCHAYYNKYETDLSYAGKDAETKEEAENMLYLYRIIVDLNEELHPINDDKKPNENSYVVARANIEESLTVGLRGEREFTENIIRQENGLKLRASYDTTYERTNNWSRIDVLLDEYKINLDELFSRIYKNYSDETFREVLKFMWKE